MKTYVVKNYKKGVEKLKEEKNREGLREKIRDVEKRFKDKGSKSKGG